MPPIQVPVFYHDTPIPGVMGEIELLHGDHWMLTYDHVMNRSPVIYRRIREVIGHEPGQDYTSYTMGPNGIYYRRLEDEVVDEYEDEDEIPIPQGGAPAAGAGGGAAASIYAAAPHVGRRVIPARAAAPIGLDLPEAGTEMANFHKEYERGRVYTRAEFNGLTRNLTGRKRNPMTRELIEPRNVSYYTLANRTRRGSRSRSRTRKGSRSRSRSRSRTRKGSRSRSRNGPR